MRLLDHTRRQQIRVLCCHEAGSARRYAVGLGCSGDGIGVAGC